MDLSLPHLVSTYGYAAVFVGTLLEGEAILLIAAYAAQQGYLSIPVVVTVAFVGATLGDQIFFLLGRFFGPALVRRFDSIRSRAEQVNRLLVRHHAWLIVSIRFAYGLRIAGPIIIGMSTLPAWRFFLFNAIGALLWAPIIASVGYLFGHMLEWLLVDLKRFEMWGLVVLLVVLASAVALSYRSRRRGARASADPAEDSAINS
jgi:membrane protein DedA with SNARE-associated domain